MKKALILAVLLVCSLPLASDAQMLQGIVGASVTTSTPTIVVTTKTATGGNTSSSVSSVTATWSTALAAGESEFCTVGSYQSGETYTVTDSASNSLTAAAAQFNPAGMSSLYMQQFYITNIGGSVTSVTFHLSTATTYPAIECNSATGVKASGALDGTPCTASWATSGAVNCGSAIVTTGKDLIYCGYFGSGGNAYTLGSGFTLGAQVATNISSQYLVQSSSGSITPTMTQNNTGDGGGMQCSAYLP